MDPDSDQVKLKKEDTNIFKDLRCTGIGPPLIHPVKAPSVHHSQEDSKCMQITRGEEYYLGGNQSFETDQFSKLGMAISER